METPIITKLLGSLFGKVNIPPNPLFPSTLYSHHTPAWRGGGKAACAALGAIGASLPSPSLIFAMIAAAAPMLLIPILVCLPRTVVMHAFLPLSPHVSVA